MHRLITSTFVHKYRVHKHMRQWCDAFGIVSNGLWLLLNWGKKKQRCCRCGRWVYHLAVSRLAHCSCINYDKKWYICRYISKGTPNQFTYGSAHLKEKKKQTHTHTPEACLPFETCTSDLVDWLSLFFTYSSLCIVLKKKTIKNATKL